ncbi:GyrI-like domain-containing protein [Alloiococcus sp. CFN-8]|uniref:GyrI-like domain-containing protein n=1 Tax=Alloiococcus sp. CFN-8 TaxID=3416081 RepID=UPI003CF44356
MTKYNIEEKDSFTVLGIGTELKSDYTDSLGIDKEKSEFWQTISQDGTLEKLKAIATNDYIFAVNEAVNNKMMHYAGVMTKSSLPEAIRNIQFPEGEYIVVKGEASTAYELFKKLTDLTFGEILYEVESYAYVGGPNTAVVTGKKDSLFTGEMWIPVVRI